MRNINEMFTNKLAVDGFIYYNLTDVDNILDIANTLKMLGIKEDIEINDDIDYLIIMRELFDCLYSGTKFNNLKIYDTIEEFRYSEEPILNDLQDFNNTLDIIELYHGKHIRETIEKELNNEREYVKEFRFNKIFKNKFDYADALVRALEDIYNM